MLEAGGEGNCKEEYQSSWQSRGTMHAAGEQQRKGKNSTARAQRGHSEQPTSLGACMDVCMDVDVFMCICFGVGTYTHVITRRTSHSPISFFFFPQLLHSLTHFFSFQLFLKKKKSRKKNQELKLFWGFFVKST